MKDPMNQGGVVESPERPLTRQKDTEKIGIEEFVSGIEVENNPVSRACAKESRIASARERKKALLRRRRCQN
jgi:hypothetical protein